MARLSASISIARRFFRGTREREGAATLKPPPPPPSTSIPQCKRPARQRVRGGMGTHNGGLCALSSGYQTSSHNGSVGKERVAVQGWQVIKERLGEAGGGWGELREGRSHDDAWEPEWRVTCSSCITPEIRQSRPNSDGSRRTSVGDPHPSPLQRPFWETHEALSR